MSINSSKVYCKWFLSVNICTTLKVLIVAKCIVNAVVIEDESVIPGVLIVAKCIVNIDHNPSEDDI